MTQPIQGSARIRFEADTSRIQLHLRPTVGHVGGIGKRPRNRG